MFAFIECFYTNNRGAYFLSSFLLLSLICVRYHKAVFEKVTISLWILGVGDFNVLEAFNDDVMWV